MKYVKIHTTENDELRYLSASLCVGYEAFVLESAPGGPDEAEPLDEIEAPEIVDFVEKWRKYAKHLRVRFVLSKNLRRTMVRYQRQARLALSRTIHGGRP
jgi:hypothetical protein